MRTKLPLVTLLLVFFATLTFFSTPLSNALIYDRDAIFNGEIWRLLSGHIVHFSWLHYAYDLIVFIVAGTILESKKPLFFAPLILILALTTSSVLFFLKTEMILYGGLSALACGVLFYLGLWWSLYSYQLRWIGVITFLLLSLKTVHEVWMQQALLIYPADAIHRPVPESHLIAILITLGLFLISERKTLHSFLSK